jgi:two-component system, cell cycle sensor histidine kinase and response regulator CckA
MTNDKIKVLLVEDNPGDVRLLREFLWDVTSVQFELMPVDKLFQALNCIKQDNFDVILLDLVLPDSQGLNTFINTHIHAPKTPIIVLTGINDETLALQAMQKGAQDYLVKGQVTGDLLVRSMRYAIQRQRSENALRDSESTLRSFYDSAAMMMGIVELIDNDILFVSCNTATAKFYNLPLEAIQNKRASEIGWEQQQIETWIQHYKKALYAQSPIKFELPYPTINGQKYLSVTTCPVSVDGIKSERVSFIIEDISENKLAQERILEQAALLDVTIDGIFVRDLNNNILFWNKAAENIYGFSTEEAHGKNEIKLLYKEVPVELEIAFDSVINKGHWQGELNKVTKTGKNILVESRWTLVRDELGQPKSILTVDTDITEKKRLEWQFFRAQRLESIGTLASGIAHDLNNILTPILATAQLLRVKFPDVDDRTQHIFEILEDSAKRGAELVKQVLSFARGVEGKRVSLQLRHLIRDVAKILRQTFPKSIELCIDISSNLWMVCGDSTQLHQVLMNLCVNARDAMPEGGTLTILAENRVIDEHYSKMHLGVTPGSFIIITVADSGVGIPAENMDRIFEPFFTTKQVGNGTGLGLSTTLGIVKSHGGFVNVYSEVGSGTQFQLYLPATVETEIQSLPNEFIPLSGNGELVLIVDDETSIQEITKASLESHNYKTLTACDGIEAIALYAQYRHSINVVLMDMMMPSMDGVTAIRALQKINPDVKIIASSGLISSCKLAQASNEGVKSFLSKPYTLKELLNTLQQVI